MSSKHSSTRMPTPRSPFEIFFDHMQRRSSIPDSQKTPSYAAHRWSLMSDADRRPFVEKANADKRKCDSVARGGMGIPSYYGGGDGDKYYDASEPRARSTSDPSDPQPAPYNIYAPQDELDLRSARPDVVQQSGQMTYGWAVDPRETERYHRHNDDTDSFQNWDFNQPPAAGFQMNAYDYSKEFLMPFPSDNQSSERNDSHSYNGRYGGAM